MLLLLNCLFWVSFTAEDQCLAVERVSPPAQERSPLKEIQQPPRPPQTPAGGKRRCDKAAPDTGSANGGRKRSRTNSEWPAIVCSLCLGLRFGLCEYRSGLLVGVL